MCSQQASEIRKSHRHKRRQLSPSQQKQHAQLLAHNICRSPVFRNARRIACYLPADGEIRTEDIIHIAWKRKKDVFLPILPPTSQSLFFALYTKNSIMKKNRFGIAEPDVHPSLWLTARQLNLILLPLVAFDEQANRMGMGGGYYDRSLSFSRHRKQWHSPYLMGLAHECQKVEQLPCEPWDVPLNSIATEHCIY